MLRAPDLHRYVSLSNQGRCLCTSLLVACQISPVETCTFSMAAAAWSYAEAKM